MTTTPGWEPRSGPTRGESARPRPRGNAGGWPAGDPRRQAGRDEAGPPPSPPNGYQRPRPPGGGRGPLGPGRYDGPEGPPPSGVLRWIGALPVKVAVLVLAAATLLGVIFTVLAGDDPGFVLGLLIILGTIVATLGVRRGGVYLFFPLPALFAFVAAVLVGEIHDRQLTSSTAGTAAGFLQWIAGIFYPMCVATIVALLIAGGRWLLARQLVSGQFPMSAGRSAPGAARTGPDRSAGTDPWSDSAQGADRAAPPRPGQNRAPWLGQNGASSARTARPQRPDRDAWGDPRGGADRNQPGGTPRPRPDARGAGPGQPRPPRPQPRDQRDPRDPRPPRPQPPRPPRDPWDNRQPLGRS
jgi:hypothetical protein